MLSVGSATPATTFAMSNSSYEKKKKTKSEHSFSQAQLSKNPANASSFTASSPGQGSGHLAKPPPA